MASVVLVAPDTTTVTVSQVRDFINKVYTLGYRPQSGSIHTAYLTLLGDPAPVDDPNEVVTVGDFRNSASAPWQAIQSAFDPLPTPQQYGAKGDGIADDTAALKALLANNDVVRIPRAVGYRITGPLYDAPFTTAKHIFGEAYFGNSTQPASRIFVDQSAGWDASKYVLHFAGANPGDLNGPVIENLQVCGQEGTAAAQVPCNGIRFENVQHASVINLYFNKIQGISLDAATMWDSVLHNVKVLKGGDASVRTVAVTTTAGSNVITVALGDLNQWDDYAQISGTGIPAGARILKASGAHGYETVATAYLSANATASGTVTATVTRACQAIKLRPYDGTAGNNTNTLTFVSLHAEANYAGSVLFGRSTRRVKLLGGKLHGLLNAQIATEAVVRFESAFANQIVGLQCSRTGRHHTEFDVYRDPVTLVADTQTSDANMHTGCYYDSAGTASGVTDGTAIRVIKGNRNVWTSCQWESNDFNVVVDTGNTGNQLYGFALGLTGATSNYQNKFSGPMTWLHVHPTTGDLMGRDQGGHWTVVQSATSGAVGSGAGAQQSDIDTAIQRALRVTPARLETMPRQPANASMATTSGVLHVAFADALFDATAPVGFLELVTAGGTVTGLTLARMAFFTRDASDNLTLVAFTADFHASVANGTDITQALAAGATVSGVTCPSTVTWARGGKYAIGYLWTGTAHPSLRGTGSATGPWSRPPRMSASVTGLTEIPATVAATSFTDAIGAAYFSACASATA